MTRIGMFLLLIFSSISASAQDEWTWINPVPQGFTLQDIFLFDENTAISVGRSGTIIKTTDGGKNWEKQVSGTLSSLNSIHFVDEETGWTAGGNGKILKTKDGGKSWQVQESGTTINLSSIFFIDKNNGWAVGGEYDIENYFEPKPIILKTTNGGNDWHRKPVDTRDLLHAVFFVDSLTGFVTGYGTIFKTTNGGEEWSANKVTYYELRSISFLNDSTGWAVGGYPEDGGSGVILKTTDRGTNWLEQVRGKLLKCINAIYFINAGTGWAVGGADSRFGIIHKTIDGGETWVTQVNDTSGYLYSVKAINDSLVWAVGVRGEMKNTNDGGQNWHSQSKIPRSYWFNDVHFVNSRIGWVVGSDFWNRKGVILKTTDGGENWIHQDDNSKTTYVDVCFADSLNGWVVSEKLLKTIDGGNTWQNIDVPSKTSVYFLNADIGWVFGRSILKTYDSGYTWINQYTASKLFTNPQFINEDVGWALNSHEQIFMTVDGGYNWQAQNEDMSYYISDIFFIDDTNGWAVGQSPYSGSNKGIVLKTADGGVNWNIQLSGCANLLSVYFTSHDTGFAVGTGSKIYKTNDGGVNWLLSTTGDSRYLESVFFTDDGTGWVVGSWGAILKLEKDTITAVDFNISQNQYVINEKIMLQSYPNPFNSTTTIRFILPRSGFIRLKVYNVLGKEIANPVNEYKQAGHHDFNWKADNLPSGLYFCRLEVGRFKQTIKLVLQN